MIQKQRVFQLVSAGGVVYRVRNGKVEVVICGRSTPRIWGLPKGTPSSGETIEQTAIREVQEETGLQVQVEDLIDKIDYWFFDTDRGARCHKTVHFYLMSATGGDTSYHDHEFDVVEWVPVEKAFDTLTYQNEVRIVQKGLSMVSKKSRIG